MKNSVFNIPRARQVDFSVYSRGLLFAFYRVCDFSFYRVLFDLSLFAFVLIKLPLLFLKSSIIKNDCKVAILWLIKTLLTGSGTGSETGSGKNSPEVVSDEIRPTSSVESSVRFRLWLSWSGDSSLSPTDFTGAIGDARQRLASKQHDTSIW